jgi:cytochrome P450
LVLQVIAEHGPGLSLAAVDAMVYAEGVIKEALRLAPPAGAMMRKTLVDMEVRCIVRVAANSLLWRVAMLSLSFVVFQACW